MADDSIPEKKSPTFFFHGDASVDQTQICGGEDFSP
jgi:hypothetical protein